MSRGDLPDDALIAELMEHPSESMALEELAQRILYRRERFAPLNTTNSRRAYQLFGY